MILPTSVVGQINNEYRADNKSLKSVLGDLEKQFSIYFSFNPDELKGQRVSTQGNHSNVESLLESILEQTDLVFEKTKGAFYVIKKPDSKFIHLSIRDEETGFPLPYATVRLKDTSLGQVADDKGEIKLILSSPKLAVLEISFLGFQTIEVDASLINNYEPYEILLKPEPMGLNDFEVKEYLNVGIASDPKANSFKILPQKMEILPGLSERDVLLSAQIISGLTSNDESAGGINVRGSTPDNTLLYWNNVPIYHNTHYFGNISSFIPSSIGSLDIYKNYIPVRYGGASSGLISIFSRNEINAETRAEASINMTHADVYAKVPFKKDLGSFMMAFRRSYNDAIPTWTFNSYGTKLFGSETNDEFGLFLVTEDEDDFNNDLSFSDVNLQWNFQPTDRSFFEASFITGRSKFDYSEIDIVDGINIQQSHNINSLGGNLAWAYRLNDNHSIKTSLSYSDYDMRYSFNNLRDFILTDDNDDQVNRNNSVKNLEFRVSNKLRLSNKELLEFGYQLNHFNVKNRIAENEFFEEDEALDLESDGFINAIFADYNFQPNDKLETVFSTRLTRVGTLGETYFSPQVKVNYSLNTDIILKSSYGIYHQYLSTIQESQLTLSNAVEQHWLLADDNEDDLLVPEVPIIINRQLTLGAIYNANSWLVDFDFYKKDIDGILAKNQGFNIEGEEGFEPGFESITGVDITVRKRWKYFRSWFSYNFQDSQVELDEFFFSPFSSSFNIRHQFRVSTTYNWKNWEFSLGYIFKTGLPFTEITDITIVDPDGNEVDPDDDDLDDEDFFYDLNFVSPNDSRLPNYHRVDLSIWHKFGNESGRIKGEVGLSIINLLNRRNIFNKSQFVDFNRNDEISVLEQTKFFLNFTPNLSLRLWL